MEDLELIRADWGTSSNNRRARFYTLTAKGRKHLTEEASKWRRMSRAMEHILQLTTRESKG